MKVTITFAFILLPFAFGNEPQCSSSSEPVDGVLSDAEFWRGIDGAEYITQLDDNSHADFIQENPKVFIMYYDTRKSKKRI